MTAPPREFRAIAREIAKDSIVTQATARLIEQIVEELHNSRINPLCDRIEKLEAALKWVGEVYPDTLPSRGARVEMTWDEFNAMREVMGLPIRKPKPRARAALNRE